MISSLYFWKPTYDDALTAADETGLDVEISLQYNRLSFLEDNLCFVGTVVIVHETFAYSRVVLDICQLPMPFVPDLGIMALMLHLCAWQLLEFAIVPAIDLLTRCAHSDSISDITGMWDKTQLFPVGSAPYRFESS
jgi:hypothetical protein